MAKENKGFGYNGRLFKKDDQYFITETVKGEESTYNLSKKLDQFINEGISISGKSETAIEPIEE